MNQLIRKIIDKRRITLFITAIIAFLGLYSFYLLPRQESPDVSVPVAMVITVYPGASPTDIKDLVTSKIEDELVELDGYDYCQGVSNDSVSVVTIFFTTDTDADKAMQDVRNAVADIQTELPSGCRASEVKADLTETAGIIISLSGENYSYEQLASFGERFKDRLMETDGISKFSIEGELKKEVKIDIDAAKLNLLNISINDIAQLLQAQNIEIPSGNIDYEGTKIKVKIPGIYTSIKDIEHIIIGVSPETGVVARLADIANIYIDIEENVEKYKQNGQNAVLLTGYFKENENVVIIGKDVRTVLDEVKSQLPDDLLVDEIIYQPDDVKNSVNDFMMNLMEGIVFVIIVVFLGMGLRNALVVSTAIPLSILITFCVMYLTGIKIHQMSLTALIIALGILVDNAIVISDATQVCIDGGEDVKAAASKATCASAVPIFTATITTIAAFSPLMKLPGAPGQFLKPMSVVLIISIIAAYIVAMFIIPSMASILFIKSKKQDKKEGFLRQLFRNLLSKALKRKKLTIITTFAILVLTIIGVLPQLPSQFFPFANKDLFYIEMNTELPGDIKATEELTDEVVSLLKDMPEISSYTVSIGNGLPKFFKSMLPATPLKDYGQMLCKYDLENKKSRFKSNLELMNYVQTYLDENIVQGKCTVRLLANTKPKDAQVIVRVSGDNLDRIREVKNELKAEIARMPGTNNVRDTMKDNTLQLEVKVDEDKAFKFGITKFDIQSTVNTALYGRDTSVYRKNGKEYNILLKSTIGSTSELKNLKIKSTITGKKVPLNQFASIDYGVKVDQIKTYDRANTIEILADPYEGADATQIENEIEFDVLPYMDTSGTKISFAGEREDIKENFGVLKRLALLAIFLIYIILMIQFNSFMQPLVILITIPLSLIGSIIGLFIFRQPLSLTAFLGIIALIGLVVKNGILLIEYINDARKNNLSVDDACMDAVSKRFNAIILSAVTTIMGLVPLAFSGNDLFDAMAISLMFGLIVSTFLTMIVIPVVYSLMETSSGRPLRPLSLSNRFKNFKIKENSNRIFHLRRWYKQIKRRL